MWVGRCCAGGTDGSTWSGCGTGPDGGCSFLGGTEDGNGSERVIAGSNGSRFALGRTESDGVGMGVAVGERDGGCRVKNNCYICEENACIQN